MRFNKNPTMAPATYVKCKFCNQETYLQRKGKTASYCKSCNCYTEIPVSSQMSSNQISISKRWCMNKKPADETPRTLPSPSPPPSMNYMLPAATSPAKQSKKRALLCGVSYKGAKYNLRGTINDVISMRELLIKRFGYTKEWIRVLTEYETNPEFLPTRANIISSMRWLVENNQPGDSLVFFYSGHGLRQPDFDDDEIDGFDETICPLDYKENGMIVDNEINSIIVSPLKEGVKLHAIVDACHSGTILDLPYVFDNKMKTWKDNKTPSGLIKTTNGGLAISISACDDDQLAADTSAFTSNAMNGAMTYVLVDQLKRFPGLTYGDYYILICDRIQVANKKKFLSNSRVLKKVFPNRLLEMPIMSSSLPFNIYEEAITL